MAPCDTKQNTFHATAGGRLRTGGRCLARPQASELFKAGGNGLGRNGDWNLGGSACGFGKFTHVRERRAIAKRHEIVLRDSITSTGHPPAPHHRSELLQEPVCFPMGVVNSRIFWPIPSSSNSRCNSQARNDDASSNAVAGATGGSCSSRDHRTQWFCYFTPRINPPRSYFEVVDFMCGTSISSPTPDTDDNTGNCSIHPQSIPASSRSRLRSAPPYSRYDIAFPQSERPQAALGYQCESVRRIARRDSISGRRHRAKVYRPNKSRNRAETDRRSRLENFQTFTTTEKIPGTAEGYPPTRPANQGAPKVRRE
jgi:hypothetical protein